MIELLADEGHHGVQSSEPMLETNEESEGSLVFLLGGSVGKEGFCGLDVYVAKVIEPEGLESVGSLSETVVCKAVIDVGQGLVKFAEDPAIKEILLEGIELPLYIFDELKFGFHELIALPDLIAKLPQIDYLLDVQVDAPALHHVGQQPEPQSIGAADGYSLSELMLQLAYRGVLLSLRQVAFFDLADQTLKVLAVDDLQGVDYVAS